MLDATTIEKILVILQDKKREWQDYTLSSQEKDPLRVLLGCILSQRTKDVVTQKVAERLFRIAPSAEAIAKLSEEELSRIIYPVGFYRRKAKTLREVSKILLEKHGGKVPSSLEELLQLPGVGRKTANLVLSVSFEKEAIAVDTHVHRIANRTGMVDTKNPEETEKELRKIIPKKWWKELNHTLVLFGQNICLPRRPRCGMCPVEKYCEKIGVPK
ncbi:MAG: endonuclease [Candidatus Atribacteria bacterium]|jgi:endonuclease-3|uniref:endonuclease III n=1 Tax=Atrimonas thermophila TaxID=3064161 RepID=UPI0024AA905C|nr:endonuclease [Candidatus Atribacteria bacterium]MDI3531294.1 endonuclease [Candidatus Atribacteria bacterium]